MGDMPDIAGEIAAAYNRNARGTGSHFERVDGVETLTRDQQVRPKTRTSRLPGSRAARSARRNMPRK